MDLNALREGASFLGDAVTHVGNIAVNAGHAVAGAAANANWEQIGKKAVEGISWESLTLEDAELLTRNLRSFVIEVTSSAAESASAAYENAEGAVKGIDWESFGHNTGEAIRHHPEIYIPVGIAAGAVTGGLCMGPVLSVAGFSSIGPVAGSLAAGVQSAGYAGAAFSTAQSAAMGGYGVAAATTWFSSTGALLGGAAGLAADRRPRDVVSVTKNPEESGDGDATSDNNDPRKGSMGLSVPAP